MRKVCRSLLICAMLAGCASGRESRRAEGLDPFPKVTRSAPPAQATPEPPKATDRMDADALKAIQFQALAPKPERGPVLTLEPTPLVSQPKLPPIPKVEAAKPTEPEPLLVAVFRAYLENRPAAALELLRGVEQPNQDMLLTMVPLIVRLSEGSVRKADPQDLAVLADKLQGTLAALRSFAALRLERACFCRQTDGNNYVPLDAGQNFRPGDVALLVVRPRNFTCNPLRDAAGSVNPGYRTDLVSVVELRAADGQPLTGEPARLRNEHKLTARPPGDYFQVLRVPLPEAAGSYRLSVEVEDRPTGRTARQWLDVTIADTAGR